MGLNATLLVDTIVRQTVILIATLWDASNGSAPQHRLSPPVNPDVGYPEGLPPERYGELIRSPLPIPGSSLALLDARFDGQLLRYWTSPNDVWTDWCPMQTSHLISDGDPPYQCVPEGAATGNVRVDAGKLVLCTSERSAGICETADGPTACNCIDDTGALAPTEALCSPAVCRCDEQGCSADWHGERQATAFIVDGDELRLAELYRHIPLFTEAVVALRRETQP